MLIDIMDKANDASDDAVLLMTLHASKGLEFPVVYLICMEEGLLPHHNSIEICQIEEERRLAYVGVTRAQRLLTLSLAKQRRRGGELLHAAPSRFLDEFPEESLEWYGRSMATPQQSQARAQSHLAGIRALLGIKPTI
jgi:ATP-dependent DNA helicase Rep